MKSMAGQASITKPRCGARIGLGRPLILLLLLIAATGGYLAYDRFLRPQPVAATVGQPAAVSRGTVAATVNATGSVVAASTVKLAFKGTGRVAELPVSTGQAVKKGDVLARLDTADAQLQLTQAQAQLTSAEAKLAQLQAGGRPEDVAQSQAQLDSAKAKLSQVKAGATEADRQAAEAAATSARAQLEKAQAELSQLKTPPTQDEITSAKASMEKAAIAVQNAQAAYDKIAWKPDAAASKEAMTLWQATTDYQAAEANYNIKMAGPRPEDVAAAEKNVESARAQVASAEAKLAQIAAGPTAEDLAIAQAAVTQAENLVAVKRNPSTEEDLRVAQAAVDQAKAAVQSAQNNLGDCTLTAPFDGVVASVNAAPGELVSGPILALLDPKALRVDVSLAETDVARVEVGQTAVLTFEALGGQRLQGKVAAIAPSATVQSGVATYLVSLSIGGPIQPGQGAAGGVPGQGVLGAVPGQSTAGVSPGQGIPGVTPGQRLGTGPGSTAGWAAAGQGQADPSKVKAGMTATASIVYSRKDDVLVVPSRAIRMQGTNRVVDVLVDGKVETRVVNVGTSNEQLTEVLDGLTEGEQVVIPSTTTARSSVPSLPGTTSGGQSGLGGGFPR